MGAYARKQIGYWEILLILAQIARPVPDRDLTQEAFIFQQLSLKKIAIYLHYEIYIFDKSSLWSSINQWRINAAGMIVTA